MTVRPTVRRARCSLAPRPATFARSSHSRNSYRSGWLQAFECAFDPGVLLAPAHGWLACVTS